MLYGAPKVAMFQGAEIQKWTPRRLFLVWILEKSSQKDGILGLAYRGRRVRRTLPTLVGSEGIGTFCQEKRKENRLEFLRSMEVYAQDIHIHNIPGWNKKKKRLGLAIVTATQQMAYTVPRIHSQMPRLNEKHCLLVGGKSSLLLVQ